MGADQRRDRGRLRPDLWARIGYVLFVLLTCWVAIHWIQQSMHHYLPKDWSRAHEHDGMEDWFIARLYLAGKNPYTVQSLAELGRSGLGHPPTTAFWFIPLGYLDKGITAELVNLSTWLLLLVHLYLCARAVKSPAPIVLTVLIFAWMFTTDGMTMHWHAIQLSEQIAAMLVVSWFYLRRGREVPAGLALGIASTLKLFPGLLILFLLFARRYRAFVVATATYLGVAAFMTATYGTSCWSLYLQQQGPITRGWVGSIRNASLQGIVLRLTSPICVGNVTTNDRATIIATIAAALLVILAAVLSNRMVKRARTEDPRLIDLPFALFTVLATFVNPWIWEHYYVMLIQPAFVLVASVARRFWPTWRGWVDEELPGRQLIRDGAVLAAVLAGMALCVVSLSMNMYAKMELEGIWRRQPSPWYHRQLHLMEIVNWLPWALMLLLTMVSVWYLSPARFRVHSAATAPTAEPPHDEALLPESG